MTLITYWSGVYGIEPRLAIAVAMHESSLNPNALGQLKEVGLYQVRPEFAEGYTSEQLFDPETNIMVGLQKIKQAKETCIHQNDVEFLVCYNYGNSNARKVRYPALFPYVKKVRFIMANLT